MGITHSPTPDSLYLLPFVQTQTTHPLERWKLFTQLQPHLRAEIFPNFNLQPGPPDHIHSWMF